MFGTYSAGEHVSVVQCYTVGKSRGSVTGPRHSDGLLGLRHELGGRKARDYVRVCMRRGPQRWARGPCSIIKDWTSCLCSRTASMQGCGGCL